MKPLFIPLKTEYFLAFKSGEKRTEYRLLGPRWNALTVTPGRGAVLSHGYSGERIAATVLRMREIKNTVVDLYGSDAMLCAIDLDIPE